MENKNLLGSFEENKDKDDARKVKTQYNSIDFVYSVNRLSVSRSSVQGIYTYGRDNNYPTKIIQISERSGSLVTAKNKQAQFVAGLGFPGATAMDEKNGTAIVINSKGETAFDLLKFCAEQKSNINIAIHVNYNELGEAIEFNLIQYEFVRKKIQLKQDKYSKYIITNIWHLENDYNNLSGMFKIQAFNSWIRDKETELNFIALEVFDYNPDPTVVRDQINEVGGIENYPGQLFYANRSKDIYQKAIYDSIIDDAQFEAEAKLFGLSNVQNGFSVSGFLKHFGEIDSNEENNELKRKINNTTGAINAGRIITMSVPENADMNMPSGMFEPTQLQNVDKLYEKQKEEAKNNIKEIYSIPNALIGRDTEGNFATQKMQETFEFYNSITEPLRQELEIELTKLFKNSVFADQIQLPIEIEPIKYIGIKTQETNDNPVQQ